MSNKNAPETGLIEGTNEFKSSGTRVAWHGTAFLVEALILLFCLVLCMAIFMRLFSASDSQGTQSRELVVATELASNAAERFAANPTSDRLNFINETGYEVTTKVTPQKTSAGTLYSADIFVTYHDQLVYELNTKRYVSSRAKSGGAA